MKQSTHEGRLELGTSAFVLQCSCYTTNPQEQACQAGTLTSSPMQSLRLPPNKSGRDKQGDRPGNCIIRENLHHVERVV